MTISDMNHANAQHWQCCSSRYISQACAPNEQDNEAVDSNNKADFANGGSQDFQVLLQWCAGSLCHDQRHGLPILCVHANCYHQNGT